MENRKLVSLLVVTLLFFSAGLAAFSPPAFASRAQVLITDVSGTPVDSVRVGDTIFVTVIDPDENRDSDEVELIGHGDAWFVNDELGNQNPVIELWDPNPLVNDHESSRPEGIPLVLQETGANTGVFRSQFGIRVVPAVAEGDSFSLCGCAGGPVANNNGLIQVHDQDELVVRYQDPTDPTDVAIDLANIQSVRAKINITDRNGTPVELWNVGNDIFVTLEDADQNLDPVTIDTVPGITLENARTHESETLTLVETGPDTGVFRNPDGITLTDKFGTALQSDLQLNVLDKDTIAVYYRAPGTAGGGPTPPPSGGTRTDKVDNGSITFERTVPTSVKPGDTFTVTLKITAKKALDLAAFTDTLPAGFTLVSGNLTAFQQNLASGGTMTATYQVRAGSNAGDFNITGSARATGESVLSLSSAVTVAAAASSSARVASFERTFGLSPERVDSKSNNLVTFERDVPNTVNPGDTFTVTTTVTAKQALELVAVNAQLPGDFNLASGNLTAFKQNVAAGDKLTNTYTVTAGASASGDFTITGTVRAKASGSASQTLTLDSVVSVGGGQAVAGASKGDPNDPHDFAMDWAKVSEANPATVSFTDVDGTEKTTFKFNEDLHITVRDEDEDFSSDKVDTVGVDVYDTNTGAHQRVTLLETGVSTGVFRNPDFVRVKPINAPECADLRSGQEDNPNSGYLCVENKDAIYVRYADDLFSTMDPFDISFTTGLIYSCETFTPDGGNKISFVNDQGNPIDRIIKGRQVFVKLEDCDANENSDSIDKLGAAYNQTDKAVWVLDRDTGDVEHIVLEETGPNTGVFMARAGLSLLRPVDGVHQDDGILQMEDRDTIEVHYQDPNSPTDYTAAMLRISPQPGGASEPTPSTTRFTDDRGRDVSQYQLSDNVYVTVSDADKNRTPGTNDTITGAVKLMNVRTGQTLTLDLTETEGDSGVFITAPVVIGEPGSNVDLEVEAGDVLQATYTDPSDLADTSQDTASVESGVLTIGPKGFFNGPNPFSTQTAFTVDGSGVTNLAVEVWDLAGQLVFQQSITTGNKLTWNGHDSDGNPLANGVYLYMITATGKDRSQSSDVGKLVILR